MGRTETEVIPDQKEVAVEADVDLAQAQTPDSAAHTAVAEKPQPIIETLDDPELDKVIIPVFEGVGDRTVYNISPPVKDRNGVECLAARVEPLDKEDAEVMLFSKTAEGVYQPIKMNERFFGEDPLIVKLADGRIVVTGVVTAPDPADVDKAKAKVWWEQYQEKKRIEEGKPPDLPSTVWWEEAYVADSFADLEMGNPDQLLYRTPYGYKDTVPIPINDEQIAFVFRPRGWHGNIHFKRGVLAVTIVNIADLEKSRGDPSFLEIDYDPNQGLPDNVRIFDTFFRGGHWGGIGNGELLDENGLIAMDGHAAKFKQVDDDKSDRIYFGIDCVMDLGLVRRDGQWRFEGFVDSIIGPDGEVLEKGRPARISHARVSIMREELPRNLPVKPLADPLQNSQTNLERVAFVRGSSRDPETGIRCLYGGISDASPFVVSRFFDHHDEWAKADPDDVDWICTARAKNLRLPYSYN